MKNSGVENLRGVSALLVFLSHSFMMFDVPVVRQLYYSPFHLMFDGQIAVIVFCFISGFFYYRNNDSILTIKSYIFRIISKVIRIYPAHIIVILLSLVIMHYYSNDTPQLFTSWSNSFWNSSISLHEVINQIFIILPRDPNLINPPSWYLTIEVKMFICMPIIIYFCNRYGYILFLTFLLILTAFSNNIFFFYLFLFLFSAYSHKYIYIMASLLSYKRCCILIFYIIISLLLLNIRNELTLPSIYLGLFQVLGAFMIFYIFYLRNIELHLLWLGTISYEFYLVHFPILMCLKGFIFNPIFYYIVSFVLSLILALGLHFLCKKMQVAFKNYRKLA